MKVWDLKNNKTYFGFNKRELKRSKLETGMSYDILENPMNKCIFTHCLNDANKRVGITNGKQNGTMEACEECFERYKQERANFSYYQCGQLLFIESASFVSSINITNLDLEPMLPNFIDWSKFSGDINGVKSHFVINWNHCVIFVHWHAGGARYIKFGEDYYDVEGMDFVDVIEQMLENAPLLHTYDFENMMPNETLQAKNVMVSEYGDLDMTKEDALKRYITHMNNGMFGNDKEMRAEYVRRARIKLNNLRLNRKSDPDRYEELERQREKIRQAFLGDNFPEQDDFHTLYERLDEIDTELTTLWQSSQVEEL